MHVCTYIDTCNYVHIYDENLILDLYRALNTRAVR